MSTATVQFRALGETVCELGEGATYEPSRDTLWWFDIVNSRLIGHAIDAGADKVVDLPFMASALAVVDDDRHLLATEHGLVLRHVGSGRLETIVAIEADNPVTRSNDARVHRSGALWVGTMGKQAEERAGSIYWYRGGELRRLFEGITITNSICFSPDGDVAYFADTRRNLVWRVACDPQTGLPSGDPVVLIDHGGQAGGLDGSVCDADGNLWNARWGTGTLDVYSPHGKPLRSINLPTSQLACPAFTGVDACRIAVTSAWQGMDEATRASDPLAGRTLLLDVEVRGRPEPKVHL